jgi:UDP-glucose 4-epimerase
MKVLVTGSAGHLGEALVRTLGARGDEVVALDVLPSAFTTHTGSITDHEFGWQPRYDFKSIVATLAQGSSHISPVTAKVGLKGYHDIKFADGIYPVE